ncbi:MAG: hypothetical protein HY042_00330, partial [Spirochaetia bacterium]|nr:hypothetical protein [Spirochaetia bacterium]
MRLGREEIIVPIVAGIVIAAASAMLYGEFTEKGSGGAGKIVGKLTYRYRIAQRKSSASVLWEDADPGDAVYGNDSVRTDDQSEAIVDVASTAVIELDPQSMIVVNVERGTPSIRLMQGGIAVMPTDGQRVVVNTDEGTVRSDGRLRLWRNEAGLQLDAERPVRVEGRDGAKDAAPGAYTLRDKNMVPAVKSLELISPRDNARTFIPDAEAAVKFEWKSDGPVFMEIAWDRDFRGIVTRRPSSLGVANQMLAEGIYYWRVERNGSRSEVRKFRLVRNPPVALLSPGAGAQLNKDVSFFWKE